MKRNFSYGARKAAQTVQTHSTCEVDLEHLLHGYALCARGPIRERFGIPSCVAASYVTCRVFEHFGFHTEPLAVRTIIFNPELEKHWRAEGRHFLALPNFVNNPSVWKPWVDSHPSVRVVVLGPDER